MNNAAQKEDKLPQLIKVCQFGMDDKSKQWLVSMFTIIFKNRFKLVEPEEAMLAVIDLKEDKVSENSRKLYAKGYQGLPSIALMKKLDSSISGNVRCVKKPLNRQDFWNAVVELLDDDKKRLKSMNQSMRDKISQAKTSGSATALDSKIDIRSKKKVVDSLAQNKLKDSIYFSTDQYLVFFLKKQLTENYPPGCAIHISVAAHQIILYPDEGMALTNLSSRRFSSIAIMKSENNKMYKLNLEKNTDMAAAQSAADGQLQPISIDKLLWSLAVLTARGRLPKGTSVNKKYRLHAWPNLTRLYKIPNAMRIASLWIKNPSSLNEIISSLGVNDEDVFSFYTAAYVLGLLSETEVKAENAGVAIAPKENKKRGLFGAILRYLKK